MNKNKNLGFTLAEVLIVIGIIGVVAALTLPNLNHATGDKETVTRLQKAFSAISEANDRAIATYGPISEWSGDCGNNLPICWMKRIGEFLKISNYCDPWGDLGTPINCKTLYKGGDMDEAVIYQFQDNTTFGRPNGECDTCDCDWVENINDICLEGIAIDVNGPLNGENKGGKDIFRLSVSDKLGVLATKPVNNAPALCISDKDYDCTWWVLEYGNLDYLKADNTGKCNDNPSIVLDGVTNTSCH